MHCIMHTDKAYSPLSNKTNDRIKKTQYTLGKKELKKRFNNKNGRPSGNFLNKKSL